MRILQTFFMLALTLAVAGVFLFHTTPQDQEITHLQSTISVQAATLTFYERQPTQLPTLTPQVTQEPTADGFLAVQGGDATPTPGVQFPTPTPAIAANNAPPPADAGNTTTNSGGTNDKLVRVDATAQVDGAGCAISPQNRFDAFDTIYGVATFQDMVRGDVINVRFNGPQNSVIYEESFTVQIAGDFCRWYVIEPDSEGWSAGSYTVSYTVNNAQTRSASYSVEGGNAPPADAAGDAMQDEAP